MPTKAFRMPVYTSTLQYREHLWEGLFLHVVVLALAKKSAVFEYKRWAVDLVPEKYTVPRGIIRRYGTRRQVQFNEVLSFLFCNCVRFRFPHYVF